MKNFLKTIMLIPIIFSILYGEVPDYPNSCPSNETIAINSSLYGKIDPEDDVDTFKIEISTKGKIKIYTEYVSTDFLDSYGELLDSSCNTIESNDDKSMFNYNFYIEKVLEPGTYYIKVKGVDYFWWGDRGDYQLFIEFTEESSTIYTEGDREFKIINPENTRNIVGDFLITGNTVECVTNETWDFGGECTNDKEKNDNNYVVKYIDIDGDSRTYNSSSAYLNLPNDYSDILWAGLFWQGNINGESDINRYIRGTSYKRHQRRAYMTSSTTWDYIYNTSSYTVDITNTDANKILFKIEGMDDYTQIIATYVDYYNWYGYYGAVYSAYADVTDLIKNYAQNFAPGQKITVTAANISTNEGIESSLGNYGAWCLVVIYKSSSTTDYKRVLIYNGYKHLSTSNPFEEISIDNLYLPLYGDVISHFASFVGEGEYVYTPDSMKLNDNYMPGTDENRPNNFDAKLANVERPSIGDNNVSNTNGIDIDIYDVTSIMTSIRDDDPNTDKVTLKLDTGLDAYFASVIGFSVKLYQPKICYEEKLYYNNQEINSTTQIPIDSKINIKLTIRNDDYEVAKDVKIYKTFDTNKVLYEKNSTIVKDVDWTSTYNFNDNTTFNGVSVEYSDINNTLSILHLGNGAELEFRPYSLTNDLATIEYNLTLLSTEPLTLDYSTSYIYTLGGSQIDLTSIPLPKCQDFNNSITAYEPALGTFNVVNENYNGENLSKDYNSPINSLYTQIAGKEFFVKVVKTKEDLITPDNYNGLVRVSLIKTPNFPEGATDELKTSLCKNSLSLIDKDITFNNEQFKETNITYNGALRDTTFRVNYISDEYGNPIDWDISNWRCLEKTYNCIWGMLVSRIYTQGRYSGECNKNQSPNNVDPDDYPDSCPCAAECRPGQGGAMENQASQECLDCVLGGELSGSICARDNFSIRPDKYSLDINSSPLIGAKPYLTDLNATLYNSDVNVSGYDQLITNNTDKNGTMSLVLPATCNTLSSDPTLINTQVQFYNGKAQNLYLKYDNVGDVNVTFIDNNWTEVDQKPKDDGSIDCIVQSDTDEHINGKVGCLIKGSKVLKFVPKAFVNSVSLLNFNSIGGYTYLSNEVDMSAKIDLSIKAILYDNSPATNYTKGCFSKDINYTISLINNKTLTWSDTQSRIRYFETNTSTALTPTKQYSVSFKSSEGNFTSGIANLAVEFNFDRNTSNPDEPFTISKNDFNVSVKETNGTVSGSDFNRTNDQNVTFYFARVHAPDYIDEDADNIINAKIYYEIYIKNGTDYVNLKGAESVDDINWYINKKHNSPNDGKIINLNIIGSNITVNPGATTAISQGMENQVVTYSGTSFPYKVKIDLNASSWLIYNRFDENATTNHFYVTFPGSAKDWAGVGKTGKTVDLNISTSTQKRIEW
ncbi:pre-peptidase C-terminal domain-containing protein [Nitrosophilus labii]|uniref:pre-peptidase C-terminal domain-containing protein n=1 Tax=Nitrosophilus labii TaxID=2706014 RepID=UPI001657312F|nr:pre-peptidase C-terminal domain-containing protein [Nitrosophilus labii]